MDKDRIIEMDYYDIDGSARLSEDGYAKVRVFYDSDGNKIDEKNYDSFGKEIFIQRD